jgi:hypothetical protein
MKNENTSQKETAFNAVSSGQKGLLIELGHILLDGLYPAFHLRQGGGLSIRERKNKYTNRGKRV